MLGVSAGLDANGLALVAATVLVGQLSIGWSNDWWDAAHDAEAGRRDKPAAQGYIAASTLRTAAFAAGAVAVPLSLLAGWVGAWHVLLLASGWVYNVALKPTPWSPLPYLVGFAALPLYVVGVAGVDAAWWLGVAGGLLGAAAHFANAAPDVVQDRAAGVLGLPQRLGARPSVALALVLLGAAGTLLLAHLDLEGWAHLVALAAVLLPLIAGSALVATDRMGRPVFTLVMLAAVGDVALLAVAA